MGRIEKGILGGFSGKVGTVIGGTWKGIEFMRSRPARRKGGGTPQQLEQRAKFSLMIKFLSSMTELVEETFKSYAIRMTGFNNALSYNLKNAVTGKYPDYKVDYSMVLVSRGDLPQAGSPKASATGTDVYFTWTDNSGVGLAKPDDLAIVAVYCPDLKTCIYTTKGAQRQAGAFSFNVSVMQGHTAETWLGFISADGKSISNSFYTGELVIS